MLPRMGLLKKLLEAATSGNSAGGPAGAPASPPPEPPMDRDAPSVFMRQFMTGCVAAIQRTGIPARPGPRYHVLVGARAKELDLLDYYRHDHSREGVEAVVAAARLLVDGAG